MSNKHRIYVYLDNDQYERLSEAAREVHGSLSGLVRQIVIEWIDRKDDRDRMHKALRGLTEIREKIQAEYGIYEGDLIEEARVERDDELESALRGDE